MSTSSLELCCHLGMVIGLNSSEIPFVANKRLKRVSIYELFRIESVNYDGTCRQLIASTYYRNPFSLTFMKGYLFWTDWQPRNEKYPIWFTTISNGKSVVLTYSYDAHSFGIGAYVPQKTGNYIFLLKLFCYCSCFVYYRVYLTGHLDR